MITADALHTQRDHAEFLVQDKNAHYILIVKKNQPGLHAQLKNLPWRQDPGLARQRNRGHGREEHRTLKAVTVTAGLAFPQQPRPSASPAGPARWPAGNGGPSPSTRSPA